MGLSGVAAAARDPRAQRDGARHADAAAPTRHAGLAALREQGYEVVEPQGTFYILVRSPIEDDRRFAEALQSHDVFVLPGAMFEMPGWFRISVTANDDMVERSLPGFGKALAEVTV